MGRIGFALGRCLRPAAPVTLTKQAFGFTSSPLLDAAGDAHPER
jgi:hypothetical protein